MIVTAKLNHLRMSPRKVRMVAKTVIGMKAQTAQMTLQQMPYGACLPLRKLLASAIANATHNFQLSATDLKIKNIVVDGGPTLYRYTHRAHGRVTPIRKRTAHIQLTLDDGKEVVADTKPAPVVKAEKKETEKAVKAEMTAPKAEKKVTKKKVTRKTAKQTKS